MKLSTLNIGLTLDLPFLTSHYVILRGEEVRKFSFSHKKDQKKKKKKKKKKKNFIIETFLICL
jgi:hypothetical protein